MSRLKPTSLKDRLLERGIDRRAFLQAAAAAGLSFAVMPVISRPATAATEATYFTWGGYDIPDLQTHYKEKNGTDPLFATFSDTEEAFQKMQGGFVVDIIHPCSDYVPRLRNAGLLQPIDTSRLKNYGDLLEPLRNISSSQHEGKTWFVPWEWGFTSFTYRTDLVKVPEGGESWSMLWDEANKGKLSMISGAGDAFWVAAIYAGLDVNAKVDDGYIAKVVALLNKQRPLIRAYTTSNTEIEQSVSSGEVVAAMSWADAATNLIKAGVPVKFAQPKEGTLTWVCGMVMHAKAPAVDKAYDIIDGMISPDIGKYCIENYGYGHCNAKSWDGVDKTRLAQLGMAGGPMETLMGGHFQNPQPDDILTKINQEYEKIKSGF